MCGCTKQRTAHYSAVVCRPLLRGWRIPKQHQAIESPVFTQSHNSAPSVGLRSAQGKQANGEIKETLSSFLKPPLNTAVSLKHNKAPPAQNASLFSAVITASRWRLLLCPRTLNRPSPLSPYRADEGVKKKAMNFWPVIQSAEEALQLRGNQSPPSTLSLLLFPQCLTLYHPINPH